VEVTVLFADIRGFTAVSEGLAPGQLAQMMNQFFTAMTEVIRAHRGTLDKYIGDAIMAFWGAPVDDPDHARHALAAACGMHRELAAVNRRLAAQGWPQLAIGVGVNTGVMTVGDMGSHHRKAYTVIGDAVNLGSRLEGLTAHYGAGVVIGEATRRAAPEIPCRELDRVQVKGRAGALAIFEPVCDGGEADAALRAELASWDRALARYRAQDWGAADAVLRQLTSAHPGNRLYAHYRERIAILRQRPPGKDWDGVWRFDTK
jgi:adenylate cyclase